uniref:S-protein homolog n=1 Tax=Physcomitrium patens TaxID=3218 RepID=A0A7I4E901_PHYPA
MATRSVLCSAAVALAVALLFTTAEGYHMSIKNNLQDRLRIHCWSDRQNLATTFVAPRNYYAFDFPTEKQSSWSCNFSDATTSFSQ